MENKPFPKFCTIPHWCVISGMGRRATYNKLGTRELKAVKQGSRTLVDVEHGLAWLRSLPAAKIRAPRERRPIPLLLEDREPAGRVKNQAWPTDAVPSVIRPEVRAVDEAPDAPEPPDNVEPQISASAREPLFTTDDAFAETSRKLIDRKRLAGEAP